MEAVDLQAKQMREQREEPLSVHKVSFRVSLHGMIHEWQLLAMFVWAVRRGFARDEKFQSQHKI